MSEHEGSDRQDVHTPFWAVRVAKRVDEVRPSNLDGVPGTHYLKAEQDLQAYPERMTDRLLDIYAGL